MASKRIGLLLILTAVVFAFVGIVDSALVVRPTKTCGNQTYVEEVADACTTILAAEVDADIQQLIDAGINNIEEANLADDAVSTAKIQDDAVTTGKIEDDAIVDDKLATNSVTSAKIADGTITSIDLANGATFIQVFNAVGTAVTPIGTDTTLATQGITMTRTHLRVIASFNCIANQSGATGLSFTVDLRRDSTTLRSITNLGYNSGSGQSQFLGTSISWIDTTTAGAHTYLIRISDTGGSQTTVCDATMTLEEIA